MDIIYIIASLLILPVIIYSLYVSHKVNSTFQKYDTMISACGRTAAEIARQILDSEGLYQVRVMRTQGKLTDHYDPKNDTVYLSEAVHDSRSVAAIGIAAHECGHAVQYAENYFPVKFRTAIVPVVNIGSRLALPILIVGLFLDLFLYAATGSELGMVIIYIGVILYSLSTIFAFVTLPCEFNASARAKQKLNDGILEPSETQSAAKVLNAAAKTYIASFAMSLIMLLRIIIIFASGRRRR